MINLIIKNRHDEPVRGGLVLDPWDNRHYKYEDNFKEEIFGAVIPTEYEEDEKKLPRMPYQKRILSCVHCSGAYMNNYASKRQGSDVFLSWWKTYCDVPHYPGGTSALDLAKLLKKKTGQCLDEYMPQSRAIESEKIAQNPKYITKKARENAEIFKIKDYSYFSFNNKNRTSIQFGVMRNLAMIGVYGNNRDWRKGKIIKWTNNRQFAHMVVITGWGKNYWKIADWDNKDPEKQDFKYLEKDYPFIMAMSYEDLPDIKIYKKHMKLVKTNDDVKVWAIGEDRTKTHVLNPAQLEQGIKLGIWKGWDSIKIISKEELEKYPIAKHPLNFQL